MGRLTIVVDDSIEEEFRKLAAIKYGARKGVLGIAITEAMKMWISKTKAELKSGGGTV